MKATAILIWILALTVFLVSPSLGICDTSLLRTKEGKEIHMKILSHHKRIDKFYRSPFIEGSGTSNPLCCISVPSRDWDSLTESKKQALADYAASLVKIVKANPFKYAGISSKAPAAPAIGANIAKMTSNSWCIMVGDISSDGRDINSDRIAKSGK